MLRTTFFRSPSWAPCAFSKHLTWPRLFTQWVPCTFVPEKPAPVVALHWVVVVHDLPHRQAALRDAPWELLHPSHSHRSAMWSSPTSAWQRDWSPSQHSDSLLCLLTPKPREPRGPGGGLTFQFRGIVAVSLVRAFLPRH